MARAIQGEYDLNYSAEVRIIQQMKTVNRQIKPYPIKINMAPIPYIIEALPALSQIRDMAALADSQKLVPLRAI